MNFYPTRAPQLRSPPTSDIRRRRTGADKGVMQRVLSNVLHGRDDTTAVISNGVWPIHGRSVHQPAHTVREWESTMRR